MPRSKPQWRQPSPPEKSSDLKPPQNYGYTPMVRERNGSSGSKSEDGDFEEEQDEFHEGSDDDTKRNGKGKEHKMDKLVKRRDQNRVSQRAFRQRKERHTKDLEAKVQELENLLETAGHEIKIVHSQMGRMEEELRYYRRLLFASTQQSRQPSSPSSRVSSAEPGYTRNEQQSAPYFSSTGFTTSENDPSNPIVSPYLASYRSALSLGYGTSMTTPHSTQTPNSSFGSYRHATESLDSCSTNNETPTPSCSSSPNSPLPFQAAHDSPRIPELISPIPSHSNMSIVNGAFWELDIAGWNTSGASYPIADACHAGPDYVQYISTGSSAGSALWSG